MAYALGLMAVGGLRFLDVHAGDPPAVAAYATLIYVGLTVVAAVLLVRLGVPFNRLGFGRALGPLKYIGLALLGVLFLQASGWLVSPLWEQIFGSGRDLTRFDDVGSSPSALAKLLLLSWTFAAFGEELAFRIVLMRGMAYAMGDSRVAMALALLLQSFVFGVVHAYQGPAGVAGTMVSGLIFGGLTLAGRWTIWPAAFAHGLNNTIGILQLYSQ